MGTSLNRDNKVDTLKYTNINNGLSDDFYIHLVSVNITVIFYTKGYSLSLLYCWCREEE